MSGTSCSGSPRTSPGSDTRRSELAENMTEVQREREKNVRNPRAAEYIIVR